MKKKLIGGLITLLTVSLIPFINFGTMSRFRTTKI